MIKKTLLLVLMGFSSLSFAQNSFELSQVYNSCAPWDGHAVEFIFKNKDYKETSMRVQLFNLRNAKSTFQLKQDSQKGDGSISICGKDYAEGKKFGNTLCDFPNAAVMTLTKPIDVITTGQVIEGTLEVTNKSPIKFKIVAPVQQQQMCG